MSQLAPFAADVCWIAVRDRTPEDVIEALGLGGTRHAEPAEAVAPGDATGILPPVPGVGGRWTLAVGHDLADLSTTRLTSLSALLSTEVQAFVVHGDGPLEWLRADHGRLVDEQQLPDEAAALAVADARSVDPTTLSGPAAGPALLVPPARAEPPTPDTAPDLVVLPRQPGFWGKLFRR